MSSIRCPVCRDLFVPENGKVPRHFLDELCAGSGAAAAIRDDEHDEKYERILRDVFTACQIDDYGVGVTTGEDDGARWIKVTVAKPTFRGLIGERIER